MAQVKLSAAFLLKNMFLRDCLPLRQGADIVLKTLRMASQSH